MRTLQANRPVRQRSHPDLRIVVRDRGTGICSQRIGCRARIATERNAFVRSEVVDEFDAEALREGRDHRGGHRRRT